MASNFTHAIVRRPSHSVIDGITGSPELGEPDYELACKQPDFSCLWYTGRKFS